MDILRSQKNVMRICFVFIMPCLLILNLVSTPITSARAASNRSLPENWLQRFNYYRQAVSLPPVVESSAYSADLAKHVNYMLLNVPSEGLWHGETVGRPGYTPEGTQAAAESNLWFPGASYATPARSIDVWMGSIKHRFGMLNPDLATTGFGFGCDSQNCGTGLNVIRGLVWGSNPKPNGVFYPGQDQKDVNRDIILTWQFNSQSTAVLIHATLQDSTGHIIPITTTSPPNGDYFNMVSVDPISLLAYGTTYTADMTVQLAGNQIHQTWNFTTVIDTTTFPYTISGNAGVSGATISYTGGSTIADGSGNYSIPVRAGWSGTVTPSKPGYIFSPPNRTYTNLRADQMGQNYVAMVSRIISGNVGVAWATLSYTDLTNRTVTSQADGSYSIRVPNGWSGTVNPSHVCYTFAPAHLGYSNIIADQIGQNYVATFNNAPICAVTAGVFRPSNGLLYLKNSNTTGFADIAINYGIGGDYPVTGDWNGDGIDTIGVYRNSSFYLRNYNTVGYANLTFPFGSPGDQPIAGDWNGDGIDTIGVYRSSTFTFYLRNSNTAGPPDYVFSLGIPGDIGIAGDWNGDSKSTVGVFRPSNGVIFLKNTNQTGYADIAINYGIGGDKPITGDWNNDGIDTIGVLRGNTFLLRNSNTVGYADISFALGVPGDMPIAGNWDGLP